MKQKGIITRACALVFFWPCVPFDSMKSCMSAANLIRRIHICWCTLLILPCIESFYCNPRLTALGEYENNIRRSAIIATTNYFAQDPTKDDYFTDNITNGNRLLIFGLGNVGALVAERGTSLQINEGDLFFKHVYGTTRSSGKEINGVQSIHFDAYQELEKIIPSCTHILVTIPPVDSVDVNATLVGGRPRQWKYFCDPVLNHPNFSLQDLLPVNTWVGYVSSTSVYGNHDGEWVTEESEVKCKPGTKAELYLRAEDEWRHAAQECDWRLHVFRCSGLYSNNRSAIHTIRKKGIVNIGYASVKPGYPTSRIHEEDVSRAILSAMIVHNKQPACGESCLWNLADDNPSPRSEVMAFGIKLLEEANLLPKKKNLESTVPNMIKSKISERESRRSTDRKRIDNQRMKDLLLPDGKLAYPSYREGLQSILDHKKEEWATEDSSGQQV